MLVLSVRTDKPMAEVGLWQEGANVAQASWQAHRELAVTLHRKVVELLAGQGKDFADVQGVVCFAGPGSFTGLRMGVSVSNALAYGLDIPVVATQGDSWVSHGLERLARHDSDPIALPHYGAAVRITPPKK